MTTDGSDSVTIIIIFILIIVLIIKSICSDETFSIENLKLFVFDMGHINETLKENESIKIHGIIGNDIMSKHEAIINFTENKIYLKLNI